jgi:hypothetical protein
MPAERLHVERRAAEQHDLTVGLCEPAGQLVAGELHRRHLTCSHQRSCPGVDDARQLPGWLPAQWLSIHNDPRLDDVDEAARARATPDLEPDPVIEAYKKDVDRTLIREQLRRSVDERVHTMIAALRLAEELRASGRRTRQS